MWWAEAPATTMTTTNVTPAATQGPDALLAVWSWRIHELHHAERQFGPTLPVATKAIPEGDDPNNGGL